MADLEWADLITIDVSLFGQPVGKQKLASQLKHAIVRHTAKSITPSTIST